MSHQRKTNRVTHRSKGLRTERDSSQGRETNKARVSRTKKGEHKFLVDVMKLINRKGSSQVVKKTKARRIALSRKEQNKWIKVARQTM